MFTVRWGEIENRFDPSYYIPDLVALEKRVKAKSNTRLRDFILRMAGGATPNVTEEEKYYGNESNGVPLLRVQNLNPSGELVLKDLKYINQETHENFLKRSQVKEGDLLVKITGVGRMAVSGVAPTGFEGNINQHIVVIKTTDRKTSDAIAVFLNTDIGEQLASRRSTGGTRPALDYPALRSIPIILDELFVEIFRKAYAAKAEKDSEAVKLLASVDSYLLEQLGIVMPNTQDNSPQSRMFFTTANKVSGGRFDAFYRQKKYDLLMASINSGIFAVEPFQKVIRDLKNGVEIRTYSETGYRYLRVTDLGKYELNNNSPRLVSVPEIPTRIRLTKDCLLISRSGSLGLVSVVTDELLNAILSSHIFKVLLDTAMIMPEFLEVYFRSPLGQQQFFRNNNGGVIPEINQSALRSLRIIIPPLSVQETICNEVSRISQQAKQVRAEGHAIIESAKQKVEAMILSNE